MFHRIYLISKESPSFVKFLSHHFYCTVFILFIKSYRTRFKYECCDSTNLECTMKIQEINHVFRCYNISYSPSCH